MALQDSDLFLVGRGSDPRKITYGDLKTKLTEDGAGGGGGIPDADADGKQYVRKDNAWVEVAIDEDAAVDGQVYGRQNGQWVEITTPPSPDPIDPQPGDGTNTIDPPSTPGSGTELDPFLLQTVDVEYGESAVSAETIIFSSLEPGAAVLFVDQNAATNGDRFAQPTYYIDENGDWSGNLVFADTPTTDTDTTYTGLIKVGENSLYYQWSLNVKAPAPDVTLAKPSVLTPPDGAGIGGDTTYFPETSAITNVGTTPAGGLSNAIDDSLDWQEVAYCNDKWIGLSQNGSPKIMWSTNGINWNACTGAGATAGVSWEKVAYGNGKYVAVGYGNSGNFIAHSSDGKSWSMADTSGIASTVRPRSVCYDDFRDRFWFVADSGSTRGGYSTNGGQTWTATTIGSDGAVFYDIQRNEFGLLAVAQDYSYYFADTDTRWRSTNGLPSGYVFYSVVYAQDKWRMVSGNQVWVSSDGINWSRNGTAAFSGQQRDIAYGNGVYILVTNSNAPGIQYSYNGVDWFAANNADTAQQFFCCGFGAGKFVALGRTGAKAVNYSLTGDNWSGDLTALTLTNDKAYNSADGSEVTTVDEVFKAGDKVVGIDPNPQPGVPLQGQASYSGSSSKVQAVTGVNNLGTGYDSFMWIKAYNESTPAYHFGSWRFVNSSMPLNESSIPQNMFSGNSFLYNGIELGANQDGISALNTGYYAYNFAKNPQFLDIVKYSGDNDQSRGIPHNLGTDVGFIIIRNESSNATGANVADNYCYHDDYRTGRIWGWKNSTNGQSSNGNYYPDKPTSEVFYPGQALNSNTYDNYIAYVFAKDVPGIIKCGTYTGNGGAQTIDVGFKPQFVLVKSTSNTQPWTIMDNLRNNNTLPISTAAQEAATSFNGFLTNGFNLSGNSQVNNANTDQYYYIAIAEDVDTSMFTTSGILAADASGTSLTLKDTTGEWIAGMTARNETEATETAPGPTEVVFTSDKPQADTGSVISWGQAEWQLSVDSNFVDKQESFANLTDSDVEQGPTDFTLAADTDYWVRTRYNSADPAAQSDWSDANHFKTGSGFRIYEGPDYYDEISAQTVSTDDLVKRYGLDPATTDLRNYGIYPLTEQPDYPVSGYVKEGDAYKPIRDYSAEVGTLVSRLSSIEADEINDDATDTALLTLIANLAQRVTDLEQS